MDTINVGRVTAYRPTGLKSGTAYYFSVSSYDTCYNESVLAEACMFTTPDSTCQIAADVTPPHILSVEPVAEDLLLVFFDEPVDRATATDASNYRIEGIRIFSASMDKSGNKVFLQTGTHLPGVYALTACGIRDLSPMANALDGTATVGYSIVNTGIEKPHAAGPARFALEQNYPNPFNPETFIGFSIREPGRSTVSVYNLRGERVRLLFDGEIRTVGEQPGLVWDATDQEGRPLASGTYVVRLQQGNRAETKRMQLIR
jgi:hypothetical protein